jgi:hypothetical protein
MSCTVTISRQGRDRVVITVDHYIAEGPGSADSLMAYINDCMNRGLVINLAIGGDGVKRVIDGITLQ